MDPLRLHSEREFHDAQARKRAPCLATAEALRFRDDDYLDHELWLRFAFAQLGDVSGRDVLDLGCGHGMASVVLARRGANVIATDLSSGYLREARRRAEANGVEVQFVQADAERLPFADHSFDRVWGHAILHHLDVERAARELFRVLRPNGVAVLCDPWGENPLLTLARHWISGSGQRHTQDERPLTQRAVRILKRVFPSVQQRGFELLGMCRRFVNRRSLIEILNTADEWLLSRFVNLCRMCRYMVIRLARVAQVEHVIPRSPKSDPRNEKCLFSLPGPIYTC
jgi:ubiquinone/menaquinone biosynthesis C-methylase UbiE